jgi:ankyrin repeat protein
MSGDVIRIEELIDAGQDVNASNPEFGMTALHIATVFGPLKSVRALIEKGADVNSRDDKGRTPLMLAAVENKSDAARLLLEKGADMSARTLKGMAALHWAAFEGHSETCVYWLKTVPT